MKKTLIILALALVAGFQASAKIPVIGISGHDYDGEAVADLAYVQSVRLAGGVPVVLPLTLDDAQIEAMLSVIDGLIMTGGGDFDPLRWYGEEPRREMKVVEYDRDDFDIKLVRAAVAKGIPVLGICRGHQAFGVAFGGALWQDIPTDVNGNVKHNQMPTASKYPTHSITVEKSSQLYSLLGTGKIMVNSLHHQGIKRMPQGIKAVAFAADGVVEAVERDGKIKGFEDGGAWLMGVQFHPERLVCNGDKTFLPIFRTLVEEASK